MVDIGRINIDTSTKLGKRILATIQMLGWDIADGFSVLIDNKEYYLFYSNNIFFCLYLNSKHDVIYNIMQVDDNMQLISFTKKVFDKDYQFVLLDNGVMLIDEMKNRYYLQLSKDINELNGVLNNAVLDFGQYKANDDISLTMRYEQMAHGEINNKKLYGAYIRDPFLYIFENGVLGKSYFRKRKDAFYRMDFDIMDNRWQYDLVALREFGIDAITSDNTVSLYDNEVSFSRFYRELFHIGDYITITGFPFLKGIKVQDMKDIVLSKGFLLNIPDTLIDFFNNREFIIKEYQAIIDVYNKNLEFKLGK